MVQNSFFHQKLVPFVPSVWQYLGAGLKEPAPLILALTALFPKDSILLCQSNLEGLGILDGDFEAVAVDENRGVVFEVDRLQHLHQKFGVSELGRETAGHLGKVHRRADRNLFRNLLTIGDC